MLSRMETTKAFDQKSIVICLMFWKKNKNAMGGGQGWMMGDQLDSFWWFDPLR